MDTFQGRMQEPVTLHKYLYTHADPVNNIDPSGNITLRSLTTAQKALAVLAVASLPPAYQIGQSLASIGTTNDGPNKSILELMLGVRAISTAFLIESILRSDGDSDSNVIPFPGTNSGADEGVRDQLDDFCSRELARLIAVREEIESQLLTALSPSVRENFPMMTFDIINRIREFNEEVELYNELCGGNLPRIDISLRGL